MALIHVRGANGDIIPATAAMFAGGGGGTTVTVDGVEVDPLEITTDITAADLAFVPAGTISATNVQAAIEELASEGGGGGGADFADRFPGLVAPCSPLFMTFQSVASANNVRGCRVVVPKDGTLRDFAAYVQTQSGNVMALVYDAGQTSSTVRTLLWSSGSVAVGAATAWQVIGDPNLAVTKGQVLDLALLTSDATSSWGHLPSFASATRASLPTGFLPSDVAAKISWNHAAGSFTAPATISEANCAAALQQIFLMCRVA